MIDVRLDPNFYGSYPLSGVFYPLTLSLILVFPFDLSSKSLILSSAVSPAVKPTHWAPNFTYCTSEFCNFHFAAFYSSQFFIETLNPVL